MGAQLKINKINAGGTRALSTEVVAVQFRIGTY